VELATILIKKLANASLLHSVTCCAHSVMNLTQDNHANVSLSQTLTNSMSMVLVRHVDFEKQKLSNSDLAP